MSIRSILLNGITEKNGKALEAYRIASGVSATRTIQPAGTG